MRCRQSRSLDRVGLPQKQHTHPRSHVRLHNVLRLSTRLSSKTSHLVTSIYLSLSLPLSAFTLAYRICTSTSADVLPSCHLHSCLHLPTDA